MATKKQETNGIEISIPPIDKTETIITIIGDTPLIMNAFSEKARRMILDKQQQKAKKPKEAKNEWECLINSLNWLTKKPKEYTQEAFEKALPTARFGFPSIGVKAAAIAAAYRADLIKNKVCMQGAFHIPAEYVEIKGDISMREDMVKIPMGGADVVFRGEFKNWYSTFTVTYNANRISLEQLIQLINLGGYEVGIGDWRVERGGNHGMFHVATQDELKELGLIEE